MLTAQLQIHYNICAGEEDGAAIAAATSLRASVSESSWDPIFGSDDGTGDPTHSPSSSRFSDTSSSDTSSSDISSSDISSSDTSSSDISSTSDTS
ncbi:unnamed protein product [Zymoseptoria tritici ST99CH_3D1]|nr:unnamed protein product [Zymoseptoria tritici ST99CH_3D1]